jgi:hypothetical protein
MKVIVVLSFMTLLNTGCRDSTMENKMATWNELTGNSHELTFVSDGKLSALQTDRQRELAALWRISDIYNGGYLQFIGNWGVETNEYAIKALGKIGANNKQMVLSECYRIIQGHYKDGMKYSDLRYDLPDDVYNQLMAKSREFMLDKESIDDLGMKHYCK